MGESAPCSSGLQFCVEWCGTDIKNSIDKREVELPEEARKAISCFLRKPQNMWQNLPGSGEIWFKEITKHGETCLLQVKEIRGRRETCLFLWRKLRCWKCAVHWGFILSEWVYRHVWCVSGYEAILADGSGRLHSPSDGSVGVSTLFCLVTDTQGRVISVQLSFPDQICDLPPQNES